MEDPITEEEERVEDKKTNPILISTSISLHFHFHFLLKAKVTPCLEYIVFLSKTCFDCLF